MKLREALRAAGFRLTRRMLAARRPSRRENTRALAARQESLDALTLRAVTAGDIPALAALHVATWNDTYAPLMTGPPVAIREQQWRQAFAQPEGWFCYVLARPDETLVGFIKGVLRAEGEIRGELSKIFLARDYQRMGLGRRLVGEVVKRFLSAGVSSMSRLTCCRCYLD